MNEIEADLIAASVNIHRPKWSKPLIKTVLGDPRMSHRPYAVAWIAMTACAADPTTEKPGRVHEAGPWWDAADAATKSRSTTTIRTIAADDCDICTRPEHAHPVEPFEPHEYVRRGSLGRGEKPTPERRAAIDEAVAMAQAEITAAKEAAQEREVSSVDEVLRRHEQEEA